jgi:WD40 repeat protein
MSPLRGRLLLPLGLALLCASAANPGLPKGESKRQVPRADRHGDPLPAGALARIGTVRLRHSPGVLCLAFSPDGKTLASGGTDQTVRLWDIATGKQVRQLGKNLGEVSCLLFSPDGQYLYSAADDERRPVDTFRDLENNPGLVLVWDLATGKAVLRLAGPSGYVTSLALSADGTLLAGASQAGPPVLWETGTGKERFRLQKTPRKARSRLPEGLRATCLALSPDGKILARGQNWDGKVELCDTPGGKVLRTLEGSQGIHSLAFAPDGRTLAVADAGRAVTLWDIGAGKKIRQTGEHGGRPRSLAFAPGGKVLACASGRACYLWDADTGKELARLQGHQSVVRCLAFSADGKRLALAGGDGALRVWDLAAGKPLHPAFAEPTGEVSVALVGAGERLAVWHTLETEPWERLREKSSRRECVLHIWSDFRGQRAPHLVVGPVVGGAPLAVSPDGRLSALPGEEGLVRLVENASGKEVRRFGIRGKLHSAWPAEFSPDGKLLVVYSNETKKAGAGGFLQPHIRLWDVAAGTVVQELDEAFRLEGPPVCFSPCGQLLAVWESGGRRPTISLWDVATGKPAPRFKGKRIPASWFTFTSDGRFLIVGREWFVLFDPAEKGPRDQGVLVCELLTGKTVLRLEHLRGAVCGAASPDGRLLALGGEDGRVGLFDLDTGKLLRRLEGHRGAIRSLAFTPDGKALVSGSADTTALVWDVSAVAPPAGKPLAPGEVDKLWADLAGDDASLAYRALARLSQAPGQAVPFLKTRLRPVPTVSAERLRQLIADLDSRSYAKRTRATEELRALEETAVHALRAALKASPPLEVRRRLEGLLAAATSPVSRPEQRRALRALSCLERPGTAEAARASLRRLAAR